MPGSILSRIAAVFGWFTALMVLFKIIFIAVYASAIGITGLSDVLQVLAHGFPMDLSVAGYFTLVPVLLTVARIWGAPRVAGIAGKAYAWISSTVLATVFAADLVLYGYWGFRLDMTPVFYLTTSPASAMASARWWEIALGLVGIVSLISMLARGYIKWILPLGVKHFPAATLRQRSRATALALTLGALLIIPIRGGLTVSTMNPGRVYFSRRPGLNHAALNPLFNLLYSASHQQDFSSQYGFMAPDAVDPALRSLYAASATVSPVFPPQSAFSPDSVLTTPRPDVCILILESFSAHLLPVQGGEPVALCLDSIARAGVLFDNFYASSFRTDRALPAILGGMPAIPSASLMKFTDKTERLPAIASRMRDAGYSTRYFYGGDANFTNMNSYLVSSGFSEIVSDRDFPLLERTGKWGAHDHVLLSRATADIDGRSGKTPVLRVIQTSSSHEPFEVPYSNPAFAGSPQKNAFAYTDSCVGAFMRALRQSAAWERTLVVIVPDHLGAWPTGLDDPAARHHVPLILTGGAMRHAPARISTYGSQNDIAATLLALLRLPHADFPFSHNLLDPAAPHFAFFSEPGLAATVTPQGTAVIDAATGNRLAEPAGTSSDWPRAYLRRLAEYVDSL
ncbi:MAG: sulfatase-like hydrolase/transferase [Bacteroides sp.]|nr:sulfatase-like hydrolase/transferase [Bacteroides sp.]